MINLKLLNEEYDRYKYCKDMYMKFRNLYNINEQKLNNLLLIHDNTDDNKPDEVFDRAVSTIKLLLDEVSFSKKKCEQMIHEYYKDTHAFSSGDKYICLKHSDDSYDLVNLDTKESLNLSKYDIDKQEYIINDLKNHNSFIGYVKEEELSLFMEVYNDVCNKERQNSSDNFMMCNLINKAFEERKKLVLNDNDDMQYEKKLLSILGFSLVGPNKNKSYIILDEDNNEVGYIKYKKIGKSNKQVIYGYETKIDSKNIYYEAIRRLDDNQKKEVNFTYELELKTSNGQNDSLEFGIGKSPYLTLWSKEHDFMNFQIYNNGLFLNFRSKTDNYNVIETVVYQINGGNLSSKQNEYSYQLTYYDKNMDLNDSKTKKVYSRLISGKSNSDQKDNNEIIILEQSRINDKLTVNRNTTVTGTIEEMVSKHQMGIDAFNHFRYLINDILPFKEEVISLLSEGTDTSPHLSMFMPDIKEEHDSKVLLKK